MATSEFMTTANRSNTGLSGFVAAFKERMNKRREYNQTLRELAELDSRSLKDLGIHRSQIRQVAYDAVYRG